MASVEEETITQPSVRRLTAVRDAQQTHQAALDKADETIASLQRELNELRSQIVWANMARDTLGRSLRSMFASVIWTWTLPIRQLGRLLGRLRIGLQQLVPMTKMQQAPDGSWEGLGLAQFLVPLVPTNGWIRIRAKICSSVSSQACLYFDTGSGFHEGERFDLAPVGGVIELDRLVPLRKTAYLIRFDPVQHTGKFAVQSFSLQPMSRIGANLLAMSMNIKKDVQGNLGSSPVDFTWTEDFAHRKVGSVSSAVAQQRWRRSCIIFLRVVAEDARNQRCRSGRDADRAGGLAKPADDLGDLAGVQR